MKKVSQEELSVLREYVARFSSSMVPSTWLLADFVTQALSAVARRAMLPPGVRRELDAFVAGWPEVSQRELSEGVGPGVLPLVNAVKSLLSELGAYAISEAELTTLSSFCSSALDGLWRLRRIVNTTITARLAGERPTDEDRAELVMYVASECDSVALAVSSLLQACAAAESEPEQPDGIRHG